MRRLVLCLVLAFGVMPAFAEPEPTTPTTSEAPRAREVVKRKPSGFWTSPHSAEDRPYRWGKLAIGGVLVLATGFVMLRLVRRANAQRAARR